MHERNGARGKVKKVRVNHMYDCSCSTEIELEDGTIIEYSHVAPIHRGHTIRAEGRTAQLVEALMEFHGSFFETRGGIDTWLAGRSFDEVFLRNPHTRVLESDEVEDETAGITYKEYKG
jgi:hypothetical protein